MRTIKSVSDLQIKVKEDELFQGKFIAFATLSKKLAELEKRDNILSREYRTKLYNTKSAGKLNIVNNSCIEFVDITKPTLAQSSIKLTFVLED